MVVIDDEDFGRVNQFKWSISGKYIHAYIGKKNGKNIFITLHRFILNTPKSIQTDHRNLNRLDNRKNNLRFASSTQNVQNRGLNKNNKSGFKGVSWNEKIKRWEVHIKVNYKSIHHSIYKDKLEAAKAYNQLALKYFGEFAWLNPV